MQALVGQALIEIRATWEGVAADTRAALAEVEGQIAATEARIGASVGGTVAEVEASSKAMAAAVKTATDEVGIAWVSASQAGTEFAVSQSEIRSGIRGATIDAQSLAASTDGLIAGFLGASQAGQVFTTTEAGMRAEMRAVAADADEAFATMFTGFATGSQQLEAQITAAITAEKALGAAAVEAASEVQILDGAASSDAATVARLGTAMEGTAASVKRVTIASAEYADELVALIERDEALGMAVGQLMARYEGLDIKTAEHIVQNRGVAASSQAVTDALAAEIVAVQGLTRETTARSRSLTALGTAIDLAAKQEQGLINVTAARARALGVASLTESEAAQVSNAYTAALERQFLATGRTANVSGAMKAALASMNPEVDKSASSSTKAAAAQMGFGDEVENAAVKFNFLTRTIRNSLFIITGLEAATAAVTIKMAEEQNKLLNLSQQFGIASAEISGFSLLSKATGESIDTINTSLRMMQKGFAGVGDGSNLAQQAFAALGIQTAKTGATARDTSTIFKQVADVMALIPDGEQKIAVGTAIMGRSFNAVIPLINQGSAGFDRMTQASRELGTELTTLELLTGRSIVTAWTDFKGAIQGVGFAIEKELAPSILTAITTTTQWISANRELVASNIAGFVRSMGSAFGSTVGFISDNINMLKGLTFAIAGATAAYKLMQVQQGLMAASSIGAFLGSTATGFANLQGAASAAAGTSGIGAVVSVLGTPITAAVAAAGASLGLLTLAFNRAADVAIQAAAAARTLIAELDRLPAPERAAVATQRAFEQSASATKARMDELTASIKHYSEETNDGKEDVSAMKRELEQLTTTYDRQNQLAQEYAQKAKEAGNQESVLTQRAIEEARARDLLFSAVKNLSAGLDLEADQVKAVESATGELLPALKAEFSQKKLSTQATEGLSRALGIEGDVIQRTVAQTGNLELGNDKAARSAARAAAQVDKFNASAAKATAQEMATQVNSLANELSRLSLPEAIERLPALLNLNAQALDAEVAAIRAETETKLGAAKTEEARNAALAEEADRVQKATVANELHAQKLVDTVTHTESAAKITEEYTKTIRGLQEAQDALKITVIDDQIKAITDSWKNLDIATRQSQLPQVLDLIAQKYDILAAKEAAESEAKIANARATYDSAEAAYALTGSQEDLASMVAALNALWDVTDAVQANAALSAEDLAFKMNAEAQAARDAAAGTNDLAQAQQLAAGMASDLSKALVDLITTGSFKDLGKQLFAQLLDASLIPFVENGLKSILGPALQGALGGSSFGQIGSTIGSGISSAVGSVLQPAMLSLSGGLAKSMTELVGLGMDQAAGGIFSLLESGFGSVAAEGITAALGATGTVAAAVLGVAGIGVAIAAAFGAFEGPTMVQQIARSFSKMIRGSLDNDQVREAINSGLQSIGLVLTPGLERIMIETPKKLGAAVYDAWSELGSNSSYQFSDGFFQDMRESGAQLIHSSVADVLNAFYPSITEATTTAIQQSALAAGAAIAREQGIIGEKAVAFANEWAISFIAMAQQTGKSADEILAALQRIAGSGGAVYAALDVINGQIVEMGSVADSFFAILNEDLTKLAGKKVRIGNLDDAMTVLTSLGFDSVTALEYLEGELEKAGIKIEQFGSDWTNAILAVSGDAGTAIRDAGQDMADFGNYSDGTAQILEQKVVTALGNVVKTAEQLGYTPESIEALGTAASLISPELLKSDAVVQALHDSFAQMAVGAHMSIRELVDSLDPPLPAAVREAILSVDDLAAALGSLSDAPLSSLKEVTDRMKQFAGDMYREVKDSEGKVSKELTAFGEQLVKDAVSAIGGMWDTITADGVIDPSDIQAVFEQLAQIPEEVLGDSSVQSSIHSLLAMIGEQTGDAFIIGLSALPEITKEQLDEALGIYDQWKKDVEDQPVQPEVQPTVEPATNPDGTPADTGASPTGPDTSAATAAPPPAPVPPETVKSWQDITAAAKEYAAAVVEGRDATSALSAEVVTRAAEMLAAIKPLYGVEDDKQSVSALDWILRQVAEVTLPEVVVPGFAEFATQASIAVSTVFGKVGELQSALSGLVTNGPYEVSVVTHYTSDGTPPQATQQPPPMAVGGWIPGAIGSPYPITAHGQELVVPAATATTLPPSLVDALLSGTAFRMPADFAPRLSPVAASSAAPAQASPALPIPPGWALVPIREDALIDRALVRLEKDTKSGQAWLTDSGKFRVHPHLRARARRG